MAKSSDPTQVFWITGAIGTLMVLTTSIWSAFRTPASVPGSVPEREPAAEARPLPSVKAPIQIEQQQKDQEASSASRELDRAFDSAAQVDFGHRLAWWSHWIETHKTALKTLQSIGSEKPGTDSAPLISVHFNCTTFVETVTALSRSSDVLSFKHELLAIRYRGSEPSFLTRNHFPESEWIPNNISAGVYRDITAQVASMSGVELKTVEKTRDRARWLSRYSELGRLPESLRAPSSVETVRVSYVPAIHASKVEANIPDEAVINFVRKNEAKRPVLITHQGLLVREGGVMKLRHSSTEGRVRTVQLPQYFKRNHGLIGFTLLARAPVAAESGAK